MSGRSVGRGGCTRVSHSSVECDGKEYQLGELLDPHAGEFWAYLLTYGALVLFTGLMSGLTMGLLSLDIMSLEVLKRGGKTHQQRYAARILQLVRRHHLLLVTLLLANAVAVEAMPIFLAKITTEVVAVIVSVIAVLVFGEVVPQAICTRFGLAIGYYMLCSSCVSFASSILPPGLPHCPPPGQNPREGPQHFLQESRAEGTCENAWFKNTRQ
jgi:ankyrin repeat/SOCS box protein 13/metal transporter CNNM